MSRQLQATSYCSCVCSFCTARRSIQAPIFIYVLLQLAYWSSIRLLSCEEPVYDSRYLQGASVAGAVLNVVKSGRSVGRVISYLLVQHELDMHMPAL